MADESGASPFQPAIGRRAPNPVALRRPEDFRRLLQRRPLSRHAGWSLHGERAADPELSTPCARAHLADVDDRVMQGPVIGVVLSRRNVRRAVTRNLMRRLWRACLASVPQELVAGWCLVLRRTAAWDRAAFPSASSDALRRRLREDFDILLAGAQRSMVSAAPRPVSKLPAAGPT